MCKLLGLRKNDKVVYRVIFLVSAAASLLYIPAIPGIIATNEDYETQSAKINTPSNFTFAAAGDWDCKSDSTNTVNNMLRENPDLILALGDFSYEETADCWLDIIDPLDERMKIVIGNHDILGPGETIYDTNQSSPLLQHYLRHFNLTKQFYSFNYQNIHFTVISSELPFEVGTEQYEFVSKDLKEAASDPNIDWMIVGIHKMLYVSPDGHRVIPSLTNTYHPLFEEHNVDLVLQAHKHMYERTYPIRYNNESSSNPIIATNLSETHHYLEPEGQIFATVGTAGARLHNVTGKSDYVNTQYIGFGFLSVDVINNNNTTTLNATYFGNDGTINDRFSITKSDTSQDNANLSKVTYRYYEYEPYLTLSGSNYTDLRIEGNNNLSSVTGFTLAGWFKTSIGSENSPGYFDTKEHDHSIIDISIEDKLGSTENDEDEYSLKNFGIWMTVGRLIRAEMELEPGGVDEGDSYSLTSDRQYSDGLWHNVVVTVDGSDFALYIDGVNVERVQLTSAFPDNISALNIRIGNNASQVSQQYFVGLVDEIRIWNRGLSAGEVADQYYSRELKTDGQIFYLPFEKG